MQKKNAFSTPKIYRYSEKYRHLQFPSSEDGSMLHVVKIFFNGLAGRNSQLAAIVLLFEQTLFRAVGKVAHFQQNGRNIRRFQNRKTGETVRIVAQFYRFAHFLNHKRCKFGRTVHGFALRQVYQNIRNLFGMFKQIKPGNDIGLIFAFGAAASLSDAVSDNV